MDMDNSVGNDSGCRGWAGCGWTGCTWAKGGNWDNCNSMNNKIFKRKIKKMMINLIYWPEMSQM